MGSKKAGREGGVQAPELGCGTPHELHRVLAVSTAHLSLEERERMENRGQYAHRDGFGWLLFVPLDETEQVFDEDSAGLRGVMALARGLECSWLMFDADAPVYTAIETYDEEGC